MKVRLYVAWFCVANNWAVTIHLPWLEDPTQNAQVDWGTWFALAAIGVAAVLAFLSLVMKDNRPLARRPIQGPKRSRWGAKSGTPYLPLVLCFVKVRSTNVSLLPDGRIIETARGYGTDEPWLLLVASVLLMIAADQFWARRSGAC